MKKGCMILLKYFYKSKKLKLQILRLNNHGWTIDFCNIIYKNTVEGFKNILFVRTLEYSSDRNINEYFYASIGYFTDALICLPFNRWGERVYIQISRKNYHNLVNFSLKQNVTSRFFHRFPETSGLWLNRPWKSSSRPSKVGRTQSSHGRSPFTRSSPEWTTLFLNTSSLPTSWSNWSRLRLWLLNSWQRHFYSFLPLKFFNKTKQTPVEDRINL